MSTLPLEVHEVLEEEYDAIHGPLAGNRGFLFSVEDVLDPSWARRVLERCGVKCDSPDLLTALNDLVAKGGDELQKLTNSPSITDTGRTLLKDASDYKDEDARKFNRRVLDEALYGAVKPLRDARLAKLYAALHAKADDEEPRAALCISGGGIRSATFALGVIQGLASAGILKKFHYLSTVSGGGYIGSWLSSWTRRHPEGIAGVEKDLTRADNAIAGTKDPVSGEKHARTELPQLKLDPEAQPIRHLRDYANYLSPKLGITSGDTWTLVSLYIRNLVLNLLVLLPILAVVLAVPRFFALLLNWADVQKHFQPGNLLYWTIGFLAWSFGYVGMSRPVSQGVGAEKVTRLSPNAKNLLACVLPLAAAAATLALFWAAVPGKPSGEMDMKTALGLLAPFVKYFIGMAAAMTLVPFVIYYTRYAFTSAAERRAGMTKQGLGHIVKKAVSELLAVSVAMATTTVLLILVAWKLFPDPMRAVPDLTGVFPFLRPSLPSTPMAQLYVVFAVPAVLLIFFVQASIFVGLSGRLNEDDDREWWGRSGGWLLFAAIVVAALGAVAVFGPVFLYRAPLILGSIGGVSGVAAALLGFSGSTPANDKQKQTSPKSAAASNIVSALIVPLFVIIALAAISLATTWLLQRFSPPSFDEKAIAVQQNFTSEATQTFKSGDVAVKNSTAKMSITSLPEARALAHLRTVAATSGSNALGILMVGVGAFALSLAIGVNKFSMHALYRNRLIRAYLGASRYSRDPDRFTGFDENDNLQMHELRRELAWTNTFGDGVQLVNKLLEYRPASKLATSFRKITGRPEGPESQRTFDLPAALIAAEIWSRLGPVAKKLKKDEKPTDIVRDQLILSINYVLLNVDLPAVAAGEKQGRASVRRNRDILAAKGFAIGAEQIRGPLHVVNTALNLVSGNKLAWQERKAESFTVSPLHSGSLYVGYRDTQHYGGGEGISIGTAVTISGAAASPNMGYNSSIPMAFLLTLFNVRLGWWLGNPGVAGRKTYDLAHPWSNVMLLFNEMIGETNDQFKYVYLSDGGHFENLGMYEMVLRRSRYIVVSDGGCDPKYSFDDLGNAIRKIRIDLGVPIDIDDVFMFPRTDDGTPRDGSYVAKARIRYSAIDGNPPEKDGILIYIKPGLYTGDFFPRDVYNYAHTSSDFPHESTADQFFSESQFESYRALGRHAINVICGNYEKSGEPYATQYASVAQFAQLVKPLSKSKDDAARQIAEAINGLARSSLVRPALVRQSRPST